MERLWSPWRMQYMTEGASGSGKSGCVFCEHLADPDDEQDNILWRGNEAFVLLNAFPYNTGHVMVAPNAHVGDLEEMEADVRAEMMELVTRSSHVIRSAMGAHGFNIGINMGSAAGAGIPGHLHIHVVPRWEGDTNFMPVIGETKVLPEMIADTYAKLRPLFT